MRVKRYVAESIEEAMAKIKFDLGTNAIILHTRYFKEGGFLGLFSKRYVEVAAATEQSGPAFETKSHTITRESSLAIQDSEPAKLGSGSEVDLTSDLKDMKTLMDNMSSILEQASSVSHFPKIGQNMYARLRKHEVEEKIAKKIVRTTLQQLTLSPNIPEEQAETIFMANILKQIKKTKPIKVKGSGHKRPYIYALVGPTGVGKTTTIAKLAAMYAIMDKKKVALLTVDTYRIAAVEHLKTIAEIMEVPIKVVYSVAQMRDAILELYDKDVIFIDTAGRSHKNALQIEELKIYLDIAEPNETVLVLPGTGKYNDLLDILSAYADFNLTRLIFTKLDETSSYGPIYNIACKSKIPIAYFTNGQNIPDDIEAADATKLVQLMMKE